jgi:hypothetical protein
MAETGSTVDRDRFSPVGNRRDSVNVSIPVASDCAALRSSGIFATVVVIELARLIWAESLDEPPHGRHAFLRRQRRLGATHVPTQPGLKKVMPGGAKSIAALRITIFTAALELRQAMEPPDVLSASEPIPLVIVTTRIRSRHCQSSAPAHRQFPRC